MVAELEISGHSQFYRYGSALQKRAVGVFRGVALKDTDACIKGKGVIPYFMTFGGDKFSVDLFVLDYPYILLLIRPIVVCLVIIQCDFTTQGVGVILKVCICINIHHGIAFSRKGINSQLGLVSNLYAWRVVGVRNVIMLDMKA